MSGTRQKLPADYASLLGEVKERVRSAQHAALRAVNKELVALYWDIGKLIVSRQKRGLWGRSVVERLASDPQDEFPGIGGFSASNLWRMRAFCAERELQRALIARVEAFLRAMGQGDHMVVTHIVAG